MTDKLLPLITRWRSRVLDSIYPVIFLDAMWFKSREEGKVVYPILGINQQGRKAILGFYTAESQRANFWLGVLNDLKNRGVEAILIACVDGLMYVVHQIRQSLR